MRLQTTAAALAGLLVLAYGPVASAQDNNSASAPAGAASTDSRPTVGGVQGVPPTPRTSASATAPKLVRHTPGKGAVTQPDAGASSATGAGASSPTDKNGGK